MILRRDNIPVRMPTFPTCPTADSDVTSPLRHDHRRRHLSSLLLLAILTSYLSFTLLDYDEPEAPADDATASHPSRSLFVVPDESALLDVLPSDEQLSALSQATRDSLPSLPLLNATYSLRNVLAAQSTHKSQFGVVLYSPAENVFTLYYSTRSKWKSGCHKLIKSFVALSSSLRQLFPDRFDARQSPHPRELALALSAGDSPDVRFASPCLEESPCVVSSQGASPILQFGSAFRNPAAIPTEIPMPVPQHDHLGCFVEWSRYPVAPSLEDDTKLCRYYLPRSKANPNGLVYDVVEWENLIPQVVWRGTDFTYLAKMRKLRTPDFDVDLLKATSRDPQDASDDPSRGMRAVQRAYKELVPRWKGVLLTAEAEWEATRAAAPPNDDGASPRRRSIPWANMKFAHFIQEGKKTPADRGAVYRKFQSHGIPAIGEYIPLDALANYKYHIDLGGGGGTTWSGTLEKLALPGLLFHHLTPTKDYFHDALVAWVHYVPIREDLSDLKQKFEWAEAHPVEAERIARRGTEWVKRWYGTEEGFGRVFDVFYRERLRGVVEAYRPDEDWREVLEREGADMRPIMRCSGFYGSECEELDGSLDYHVDRS